jgi:DNA polymerase III epsilon subunit-like protein
VGILKNRPLVFFDLETTGLDAGKDRVVEFGALKVHPSGKEEKLRFLINPEIPIPPEASAIHGHTAESLRGKLPFRNRAYDIHTFFKGADIAGYNVFGYDLPLIQQELKRAGSPLLDVKEASKIDAFRIFKGQEGLGKKGERTLSAASEFYLGKPHVDAHGAMADVQASADIFFEQQRRYGDVSKHVIGPMKYKPKAPLPEIPDIARRRAELTEAGIGFRRFSQGQIADARWAAAMQEAEETFVRESYRWDKAKPAGAVEVAAMAEKGLPAAEAYGARPSRGFRRFLTKKNAMIAAGAAVAAWMIWPKVDDNTIEAMAHGGWAGDVRRGLTDFGSGYRGPNPQINPAYNLAQEVPRYEMMRASQIGKSEAELYKYFTRDEEPSEYLAASASAGTALHMLEEAKRVASGEMGGAEELLWDPLMRISGHTDISLAAGQPVDIKTVSQRRFEHVQRGGAFQRHISQLNWYMHMKNAEKGYLEYISREDTSQRQLVEVEYSEARLQKDLAKLEKVRQRVRDDIESGRLVKEALPKTASIQTLRRAEAEREELGDIAEMERIFEEEMRYLNRVKQEHFAQRTREGLRHGGWAERTRRKYTHFGSGADMNRWTAGDIFSLLNSGVFIGTAALTGFDRFGARGAVGGAVAGLGMSIGTSLLQFENADNTLGATLWNGMIEGVKASAAGSMLASSFMKGATFRKIADKRVMGRIASNVGAKSADEVYALYGTSFGIDPASAQAAGFYALIARGLGGMAKRALGGGKTGEIVGTGIEAQMGSPTVLNLLLKHGGTIQDIPGKEYIKANVKDIMLGAGAGATVATPIAVLKYLLSGGRKNTIEGLHPGSEGMGAQSMRAYSEFGSGWTGGLVAAIEGKADVSPATAVASYLLGGRRKSTIDGIHPGSEGMGAQSIRTHSDFGTGFDPMRRIAQGLFPSLKPAAALETLFGLPAVKKATQAALKTEGKALGKGSMAEIRGYTTEFAHKGRTYPLEFAAKRELPVGEMAAELGVEVGQAAKYSRRALETEAVALRELGELQAPSFYGRTAEGGIIMERLRGAEQIAGTGLTGVEAESLSSFIQTAHRRGFTHSDLHGGNIVRVMGKEGKREVVALDWGTANRFVRGRGVGGYDEAVWETSGKIIQEEAERFLGATVTLKEYAQMADLKRIQAHTMKGLDPKSMHHMGVNAPILHFNKALAEQAASAAGETGPTMVQAAKELVSTEFQLRQAVRQVFRHTAKSRGAAGADRAAALAEISPVSVGAMHAESMPLKGTMVQIPAKAEGNVAFADTMLQQVPSTRPPMARVVDRYDRTRILQRNNRFYNNSKTAVGIGLRAARRATKGHTTYSSTVAATP